MFLTLPCVAVSITSLGQCSDVVRVCAVTQLSSQSSWQLTSGSGLIPAPGQKSTCRARWGLESIALHCANFENHLNLTAVPFFFFFFLQDPMDLGDEDEDDEKVCRHVLFVTTIIYFF